MDRSSQTFARTLCSSAPSGKKNILISFLNSILKTDRITDVEYRNVEMLGLTKKDRKDFYNIDWGV